MKMPLEQKEEAAFSMAPMIDMVFLLLVFFMTASTMSQRQNIKLDIAEATKAVVPKERPDRIVINVKDPAKWKPGEPQGELFYGEHGVNDVGELAELVKEKLAENPKIKVYLRADKDARSKNVKKIIQEMAKVGVSDFIFGVFIPSANRQVESSVSQ